MSTTLSQRLQALMQDMGIKTAELARRCELPQPTVHRIVTGKTPHPHLASLNALAAFFSVTSDQLRGLAPLTSANLSESRAAPAVIPWGEIPSQSSWPTKFATYLNDESMSPQFSKGCLLIFNKEIKASDHCYALIHLKTGEVLFRKILKDGAKTYIQALNAKLPPQEISLKQDIILGVLTEMRVNF